jgi:hypothetical protein
MGRPKINQPRSEQLNLSFTVGELASIKSRAEALGLRPAQFGRLVLLAKNARPTAHAAESSSMDRLIHQQLCRLGNNLNQMMRRVHETGEPVPADLEPLLVDIRQQIAKRAR